MPILLKPRQACDVLGVSYPTLVKLIASGDVPAVRIGSQWRINQDKLMAKLASDVAKPIRCHSTVEEAARVA